MNEEELYKLAISDVSKYSLLNEILAIRDNRFPDEENDYTIKVYGSVSLDVLNKYVRNINELEQLQNNWNELKKWLEEVIEDINKIEYQDSYDISEKLTLKNIVKKMQELED